MDGAATSRPVDTMDRHDPRATELLTIKEIADRLGIPESTVRYYRNRLGRYIPTIGTGRNRRHPAEAVEYFRMIALAKGNVLPIRELSSRLSTMQDDWTGTEPSNDDERVPIVSRHKQAISFTIPLEPGTKGHDRGMRARARAEAILRFSRPMIGDVGVAYRFFTYAKMDVDNMEKHLTDCLTGVDWYDDIQIVESHTYKIRVKAPGKARTIVEVWAIEPNHGQGNPDVQR